MALIFTDTLQATDGSGLYTLMGYVNSTWVDIYTITGSMTGSIIVGGGSNTIDVDTTMFMPGQSYYFKWVDGNGAESNIRSLLIPDITSGSGSSSDTGSGSTVALDLITLVDGGSGMSMITYSAATPQGGLLTVKNLNTGQVHSLGEGPFDYSDFTFEAPDFPAIPGDSYQLVYTDDSGNVTTGNIYNIPGSAYYYYGGDGVGGGNLSTIQLLGLGNAAGVISIAYAATLVGGTYDIWIEDRTALTNQVIKTDLSDGYSYNYSGLDSTMPFVAGHEYYLIIVTTGTDNVIAGSTILTAVDMYIGDATDGSGTESGMLQLLYSCDTTIGQYLQVSYTEGTVGPAEISTVPVTASGLSFNTGIAYQGGNSIQLQVIDSSNAIIAATPYYLLA